MASPGAAGRGDTSITVDPDGDAFPANAACKQETRLNRFVLWGAFGEWAGNALGKLASLWATVVLLGGYCTSLDRVDFWVATVMMLMEAFRMFSSKFKWGQLLFGTTKAIRRLKSLGPMSVRPKGWNEVVAIMGLSFNLVDQFPFGDIAELVIGTLIILAMRVQFPGALQIMRFLRRHRQLLLWALLVAVILLPALQAIYFFIALRKQQLDVHGSALSWCLPLLAPIPLQVVAVLLLNLRPPIIANLTNSAYGRKVLSWAKVILALCLIVAPLFEFVGRLVFAGLVVETLTILVLSLGSLQTPVDNPSGRWVNIILHLCFLVELLLFSAGSGASTMIAAGIILAVLLIGNLQIPAAVARVVLSIVRLSGQISQSYKEKGQNLGASLIVFYVLELCQGTFYVVACVVELFSSFPRRSLVRHYRFTGHWGMRAIDAYYQRAYATCMETGVLAAASSMSLERFSIESLSSSSLEMQHAGVCVLYNLLMKEEEEKEEEERRRQQQPQQQPPPPQQQQSQQQSQQQQQYHHHGNSSERLILRITSSNEAVCTLIGMLGWRADKDRDTRLFAAWVIAKLASRLRIALMPSMVNSVSSLLDASINRVNVVGNQPPGPPPVSRVCQCWQRMKKKWFVPKEPTLPMHSLPVLGMKILLRLADDFDNRVEIGRATDLILKITEFISYSTTSTASNDYEQALSCSSSSLKLIRRLAFTGGKIGIELRRELWDSPFLLSNLVGILADNRGSSELWEPAMDIIAKFALDGDARQDIGRTRVIIDKLMHVCLRRGMNNKSLRIVAGEALANLAMESPANCSVILSWGSRCEIIKDLKNMISEDDYRYVASSLLQNLCAHSRGMQRQEQEHLSSLLPVVMEKILLTVEGKELEALIGLALQICTIIPPLCPHWLESHTNAAGLVRKLVETLNCNKKPSPEYPRMRRVIVKITKLFAEFCHRCAAIFIEAEMLEALSNAESTPSKVENYRIFIGNAGVVLEDSRLSDLVAEAKGALVLHLPASSAQPGHHA